MKKAFYLENWLVEPALDRIRKNGSIIKLRPQVMDLLLYIANRPREIVTPDEILAAVWPGKVTTHASVYNCLKELRHALDDDPHEPRYIETIPKRGYRLIAPVKLADDADDQGRTKPGTFTKRRLAVIAAAIILAVVIMVDRLLYQEPVEKNAAPDIPEKSIAVLPFTDMSPEGDQAYFADGIAEEILDELAQSPDLKVTARSSSFVFRGSDEDLRTIGQKLGVAHVLEGSVRKDADRVRVTAQLVDTRSGYHLWSRQYDRSTGEILVIQDSIGTEVANALQVALLNSTTGEILYAQELEPRVYDIFLKAKSLINQKRKDPLIEATKLLHEIIEVDPDFYRARILTANSLVTLNWEYGVFLDADLNPQAPVEPQLHWKLTGELSARLINEVREIISLEPGLAEAYLVLGRLLHKQSLSSEASQDDAEAALLEALRINPNLADAHRELGRVYYDTYASVHKVISCFRRAVELDPYSVELRMNLAAFLSIPTETREEMWSVFRSAQRILPWTPRFGDTEATMLQSEGRYADAIRVLEDTISREEHPGAESKLAMFWYSLGETGRAREIRPGIGLWRTEPDNDAVRKVDRCEDHPEVDPLYFGHWLAYVCLWHRKWTEAIDHLDHIQGPEELLRDYHYWGMREFSIPATLAMAHKMTGNPALAERYAAIEQAALDGRFEHGKIRNRFSALWNARLLALRGHFDAALDELNAALEFGFLHPVLFGHPVYDEVRNTPRFHQLQNRRIELVNVQRAQLGLDPLPLMPVASGH